MSQNRSTIEINGKQYDAITGRLVSGTPVVTTPTPNIKMIDGIQRPSRPVKAAAPSSASKIAVKVTTPPASASKPARDAPVRHHVKTEQNTAAKSETSPAAAKPAAHKRLAREHTRIDAKGVHRKAQKSATLMRRAVKKPISTPAHHVAKPRPRPAVQPVPAIVHKTEGTPPERLQRANLTSRSRLVSKFGSFEKPIVKKVEPMAVQPTPKQTKHKTAQTTPPPTTVALPKRSNYVASDDTPALAHHTSPATTRRSILDKGLEHASSHHETHRPRVSRRHKIAHRAGIHPNLLNIGAASLVGLLLVGFLAYQNHTAVALRVAQSRAGVSASVPAFVPAGFAMNTPIEYAPGSVTLSFNAGGDDRSFRLTQTESAWNTDALFANVFESTSRPYQMHVSNGQTIYTYGEGNATWVSGGILYTLEGNAKLGNEQLLKIAASL